jgi:hypothetical protein
MIMTQAAHWSLWGIVLKEVACQAGARPLERGRVHAALDAIGCTSKDGAAQRAPHLQQVPRLSGTSSDYGACCAQENILVKQHLPKPELELESSQAS